MSHLPVNTRKHVETKRTRAWAWCAAVCLSVCLGWYPIAQPVMAAQEEGKEGNIAFQWAFGALVGDEANRKLEPVTADRSLKAGDRLKMMVELEKPCYVYVVYYGPQDQVKLLFPYTLSQLTTDYTVAKRYYIPQGDGWFELDQNAGNEAFHVLASAERLKGLEAVLSQYDAVEGEKKSEVAKQVLAEIRDLKKQSRQLAAPAERPISIGGNVRGLEKPSRPEAIDVATIARDITASGFYSRSFTIEHR